MTDETTEGIFKPAPSLQAFLDKVVELAAAEWPAAKKFFEELRSFAEEEEGEDAIETSLSMVAELAIEIEP